MTTPLAAYMERAIIGDADFAALINKDRSLVSRLRRGVVRPTLEVAAEIENVTGGEVPMQAWVDLASPCDSPAPGKSTPTAEAA